MPEIDLGPVIGPQGEQGPVGKQGPEGPQGEPGVVDMDTAMEFTEASTRENINNNESLGTILGKIKKFFTDLKPHAFKDPANNFTTTDETTAAAAPTVKQLKEEVDTLNSALSNMLGNLALTGGKVVFESHVYNSGEVTVDGNSANGICTILYVHIYYNSDRSIMIGTMIQAEDGNFFSKYVASPVLLINKNITSYWSNWVSITPDV